MEIDREEWASVLTRLEAAWDRQAAPIAHALHPGLTQDEIDSITAPTGLVLPDELRTWWGWHDGGSATDLGQSAAEIGPGGWLFLPLQAMVEVYHAQIRSAPLELAPFPDWYWHPSWFPIVISVGGPSHVLFADTSEAPKSAPSPVRHLDEMWSDFRTVRSSTLLGTVTTWVHLLETGTVRWDRSTQQWTTDYEGLTPEQRRSACI